MSTNWTDRARDLGRKAAQVKAAIMQAPAQVAEVRQVVNATRGQLAQLKTDIQTGVAGLKADNEFQVSGAIEQVHASLDALLDAGFVLGQVDIEISPVPRLLLHLSKVQDVHPTIIRRLVAEQSQRPHVQAVLTALLQARNLADTFNLEGLTYDELIIGIGPVPSVRLCWHASLQASPQPGITPPPLPANAAPAVAAPAAGPAPSTLTLGTIFERKMHAPTPTPPPVEAPVPPPPPTKAAPMTHPLPAGHAAPAAKEDPLARFKKMPVLTKR